MSDSKISSLVRKVLIIGGGIGGMAAAIRFREQNIDVDLIDIDPDWKAYGAGLTLSSLTLRALCDLGFADDLMKYGNCADSLSMYSASGDLITKISAPRLYSDDVPGQGGIMRPVLHKMMAKKTRDLGTNVQLGISVTSLENRSDDVAVTFSDGSKSVYDIVVGADGLFSRTRGMILADAPKPKFTGQACWRVQFDIPQGWNENCMYIGKDVKLGFTLCAPDKMYMYLLETVPNNPKVKPQEYLSKLTELTAEFTGPVEQVLKTMSEQNDMNYRPLEAILLEEAWSVGRVVLLGDAAHATTPHLGAGAGMAVEDAIVLVQELEKNETVEKAFDAYFKRRLPRGKIVVGNSLKLGELEMSGAPMSEIGKLMGESFKLIAEPY